MLITRRYLVIERSGRKLTMRSIVFIIPELGQAFVQMPVGVLHTASRLEQENYHVSIIDLRIDTIREYLDQIRSADIIFLVTSTYDFMQCYRVESLGKVSTAIQIIRNYTGCKIFLLGAHGTVMPRATLQVTGADGIIRGEFEENAYLFLKHVRELKNVKIFPPLTKQPPRPDLDRLFTDYSLVKPHAYSAEIIRDGLLLYGNCALVLGNRGCPFRCRFCYNFFGTLRQRQPDAVFSEIRELHLHYNITDFFFLDYTFTADHQWVKELCSLIIATGIDIRWVCQTRCDRVSRELLEMMKCAGCSGIWYGVENPFVNLKGESHSKARIEYSIAITKESGLLPILFLLFKLPYEKRAEVMMVNTWLNRMQTYFAYSPFVPRPGTALFDLMSSQTEEKRGWDGVDRTLETIRHTLEDEDIYLQLFGEMEGNPWRL